MNYANVSAQYGKSWVDFSSVSFVKKIFFDHVSISRRQSPQKHYLFFPFQNFVNPNTKLLLGVPAPGGGNGGDSDVLPKVQSVVPELAQDHPDLFGGVMFWDCF